MAFEYRPFVNPYISSMTDLMGQGTEARSRAELSAAEAEAGGQLRLGDLTQQKWSGLGNTLAGGIDDYVTEQREAPIREEQARLRGLNIDVAEHQLAEGARTAAQGVREDEFTEALKARVLAHENPETGEIDYPALTAELRRDFPDLPELVSGVEKIWQDEVTYARNEAQFGREETGRREQEQRDRARLMGMQGLALASADPAMTDEQNAELADLTRRQMLGEGIDPSKITPAILDPERAAREARSVAAALQQGRMDVEGLRQRGADRRSQASGGLTPTQLRKLAQDERRFPEAWRQNISREWLEEGATYETAMETVRRLIEELAATDPGAAASVDPALAIAYVGRLYGRPLTPDQVALMDFLGRRGDSAPEGPPATGGGT